MPTISKETVNYFIATEAEMGQRLDNCLSKILKGVPQSHIRRIMRTGEVRLNKKRVSGSERLALGDEIRIPPIRIAQKTPARAPIPSRVFPIIYEDDALLVMDKPAGVAVHGGSGLSFGVIEQLRQSRPEARYLELVHRLDKDTSGLLMIAKKRSALVKLHQALRENHPEKTYLALGVGHLTKPRLHIRHPLIKYTGAQGEKMVRVDEAGQSAHTIFQVVQYFNHPALHQLGIKELTLVKATLKTGRTHQIRVHLQAEHCPIAGDERYGDYEANRRLQKIGLKRMFLHAHELKIIHPLTNEPLHLIAPLPKALVQLLGKLAESKAATKL